MAYSYSGMRNASSLVTPGKSAKLGAADLFLVLVQALRVPLWVSVVPSVTWAHLSSSVVSLALTLISSVSLQSLAQMLDS